MVRNKYFVALLLCFVCAISALAKNDPFSDLYNKYFKSDIYSSYSKDSGKCLKSFVGDTIYFDTQSSLPLVNVTKEVADTFWIKEKRSKNPKEGKDFLLCHNYKGVRVNPADKKDKRFYTPASEFSMKPFALLNVKEMTEGTYITETVGYTLTLVEPETANLIYVTLRKGEFNNWRLYSKKINDKICLWINKLFYREISSYPKKVQAYTLTHGEMYLSIDGSAQMLRYTPYAQFILSSDNDSSLTIDLDNKSYRTSYDFISKDEYDDVVESERTYEIDYAMPADNDTTMIDAIKHLPFRFVAGRTNTYSASVYQKIEPKSSYSYSYSGRTYLSKGTLILIADKIRIHKEDYYVAALDGKSFYIKCKEVDLIDDENEQNLNTLLASSDEVKSAFFLFVKELSRHQYLTKKEESAEQFLKLADRGIIVTEARPYDESEYTDGTGMTFSFINTSKKTIKYITFSFTGYNAVDDPVSSGGSRILTRKGIGPVEPYESATYTYEYVWFTDVVDYAKVHSMAVQYTDGTSRTFTGATIKAVSDDVINSFTAKSQVEDLLPKFNDD